MRRPTGRKVDIGLDLTSNELRCVAVSRRGKEIVLERFAIGEIPTSVFAAGRVSEPAQLGARIRQILAEGGLNARKAIMSLSGKAAITRIIELPKMGAAQTRQAISLQINQYVPFPPGDTVYDYKILPTREGGNPAMQEVLLVATRASTVDSLIQTLRAAGIEPDGIKITSLAAWNLLETGLGGYTQAVGVIDLRDTVTDLSFFLNNSFRLSRPVELGYYSILGKVAQLLGISQAEAEEYLKNDPVDITIPEDEIDPTEDNRMREALLSVFSGFVSELIRSIRYYESQAQRSDRVGKLLLFGNVTLFPNIEKYLEDQTGLEVNLVSFSSLVQYRQGVYSLDVLHENASKLVVSAGLAIEGTKKKKELNLMPPAYYTRAMNTSVTMGFLVLALAVAAFGYFDMQKRTAATADIVKVADTRESEAAALKPDADKFDQTKAEIQGQLPRFHQIFGLFKEQRVWPAIMEELGNRTNDRVWLTEVDFEAKDNTIKMKGVGVDRVDILQFAINMDKSPFFTNTSLKESADDGGTGGGTSGGGGGGGGGGPAGLGVGSAPAPNSAGGGGGLFGGGGGTYSGTPLKGAVAEPMQDYRLPRFDFQPGASIEDFFQEDFTTNLEVIWKFEVTTTLQTEIVNQKVQDDTAQVEVLIDNVLKT
ncbi:MAG: type IV pilus assembly protein PilM [bacterium]|nr:type IV pilus assembly protein PilM [bacterium]